MANSKPTNGEQLFEQYLVSLGLQFDYEPSYPGKLKVLDYVIEWNGRPHFFEVKDFESPPLRSASVPHRVLTPVRRTYSGSLEREHLCDRLHRQEEFVPVFWQFDEAVFFVETRCGVVDGFNEDGPRGYVL
jgi:hypothetical protein